MGLTKDETNVRDKEDIPNKSFFAVTLEIFGNLSRISSVVISFAAFAFMIGWFQAGAYFQKSGAEWLTSQLDASDLIRFSWIPVIMLLFFLWLSIDDLSATQDQIPNKRQKITFWIAGNGWWIALILFISTYFVERFAQTKIVLIVSGVTIAFFLLYSSSAFEAILILVRNRKFLWDRTDANLVYVFIVIGFYYLPTQVGALQARMDSAPQAQNCLLLKQEIMKNIVYYSILKIRFS